jgi:uncharacterized membrane protein
VEFMSPLLLALVTLLAALGCGLSAGVFFAFSTFVMPALFRLPPQQGIAAMQSINVAAINIWLLGVLLGTAAACVLLAVSSPLAWSAPGGPLRFGGSLLYLLGCILVTRAFNIPRNDALAALSPESAEAASLWSQYVREWTAWNHVRAAAALLAALALTVALRAGAERA